MKNVVTLDNYYFPGDLKLAIGEYVEYYNNHRYHESLDNLTPADVYHWREQKILRMRDYIKEKTLKLRRFENLGKGVIRRTKKSLDFAESVS
ncbi:MAG: IS3 family transposase [Gemmatimonadota bacterium]|nr:MAG: IS3 family transposase [Gemmatimonadota bacterium]